MKKVFITITGCNFRHGTEFAGKGDVVNLKKEPDNEYDKEAIEAKMPGIGTIGYVANSVRTVIGDCLSGGRVYDLIGDEVDAVVRYILKEEGAIICEIDPDNLVYIPKSFVNDEQPD